MLQLSHPYMTTGKTITLTIWTFVSKMMSLLLNMLSRFGIAFLPKLLDNILKSREIFVYLLTKVCRVKAMVFLIVMYGCESWIKENWEPKNWCFWVVVLEKTVESPLDSKEIKPVNSKGNQPWIFIGKTDVEAEALIVQPPDWCKELTH